MDVVGSLVLISGPPYRSSFSVLGLGGGVRMAVVVFFFPKSHKDHICKNRRMDQKTSWLRESEALCSTVL